MARLARGPSRHGMAGRVRSAAGARAVRSGELSGSPVRIQSRGSARAGPVPARHGWARQERGRSEGCSQRRAFGLASADRITRRVAAWPGTARHERGKSRGCSQRRAFGLTSADRITRRVAAWPGRARQGQARHEQGLFAAASFRARQCGSHRGRGLACSGPARHGADRHEQGLFAAASFRARQCGSHHPARSGLAWQGSAWHEQGKSRGCSQRRAFGLASADRITCPGGARPGKAGPG